MLAPSYDLPFLNRWREAITAQRHILFALLASFIGYFGPSRLPLREAHEVPITPIDRVMPLIPWTVFGYVLLYPFLVLTVLYLVLRPAALRPVAYAIIAANLIGGLIFTLYRTTVPRPALAATGWDAEILRFLWSIDPPYNALPSLHAAYGIIIAWGFIKLRSRWTPLVLACSAIVVFTTLTTHQHRFLDLVGGAILAAAVCLYFYRRLGPWHDRPHW
ncbi:MAG: hypothetical protein KatS3mg057_0891 [Herpetosiphonaceae bacterium]|nr:MAG: hypothetical protein KatS3mg057_0891 [Herpetosiphonaceae bacterium]